MIPSALTRVATGGFNASILVTSAGLLLLYVECNRPGRVIPGVVGLLLLLLGLHSLSQLPLRPGAIFLVTLAFALLALTLRGTAPWLWLLAGTALLSCGLARLPARQAWSPPAALCGLVLGSVTGWLATIAGRARRSKRHPHPTAGQPSPRAVTHGWE